MLEDWRVVADGGVGGVDSSGEIGSTEMRMSFGLWL